MHASGRSQISAPKGTFPGSVTSGIYVGVGVAGQTKIKNFDTYITTATTTTGTVNLAVFTGVADRRGFGTAGTIIIGYGLPNEERLTYAGGTLSAQSDTVDAGALSGTATTNIKFAHAVGERCVMLNALAPLRPGSVRVRDAATGAGVIAVDDGNGTLVNAAGGGRTLGTADGTATNTVDYNTGSVSFKVSAGGTSYVYYVEGDTMTDVAAVNDVSGSGFFKNFNTHSAMKRDAPDFIVVTNLGDSEVGVLVEQTKNDGRSYTQSPAQAGIKLGPKASGSIKMPAGSGPNLDGIRIRASSAGWTLDSVGTATTNVQLASTVEIGTVSLINDNGQ